MILKDGKEYINISSDHKNNAANSREDLILWQEDFENNAQGWTTDSGWHLTIDEYYSATHSMHSPNDESTLSNYWDLVSPAIELSALGEGETMHFGFFIKNDMPDDDGDGNSYLDDYYHISIKSLDFLSWHASSMDALDGNSYWCGDEEVGGYLDNWMEFMDTPEFTVPSNGILTADMMWKIEDPAGADTWGETCADGWDAANVRISIDSGDTWSLLHAANYPYDFICGHGWITNDSEYDTGGSLHHLASGWGGNQDWVNVSFDLSEYTNQNVIVRFAFASDPAYCTLDDNNITGFHVDNIVVSGAFECNPENSCDISVSSDAWVDQFYDYSDIDRPGYQTWDEFLPGMAFNNNPSMDISDFAEETIQFRIQSRYDDNHDGGSGAGLFIDDLYIYKSSSGNYPAPMGLTAEGGDSQATLSWDDINASGTDDFVYDNNNFTNGITMANGSAWAGTRIDLVGSSIVNSVSVFNTNEFDSIITLAAFGQFGSLFENEPSYTTTVNAASGAWTTVDVSWQMNNSFIIAHEFNGTFSVALDESSRTGHSMVMLNADWDNWSEVAASNTFSDGEWGIRTNITFDGGNVTYNVYKDGVITASDLTNNSHTATGLINYTTYEFTVSATYLDGEESEESDPVEVWPLANNTHEEGYDDGDFESEFHVGSGNFTAVNFSASSTGEEINGFKWFQYGDGGAFYIKVFDDNNGMPGDVIYTKVIAGGLVSGWNHIILSDENWAIAGDFWIGMKEISSTMPIGLDTSSNSGNSYYKYGNEDDWLEIDGNLALRVFLTTDCGTYDINSYPDPNADSNVDVLDVITIINHIMGTQLLDELSQCTADINIDSIINVIDVVNYVELIMDIIEEEPAVFNINCICYQCEEGITGMDCYGACGGLSEYDECGVCGGDGTGIECYTGNGIWFENIGNNNFEILYTSNAEIKGIEFNIIGANILGISGGVAQEAGFVMSHNGTTLLGFSFSGAVIPAGENIILTEITLDGFPLDIHDIFVSDAFGDPLYFPYNVDSFIEGCTDALAENYNPDANTDDGSCEYTCIDDDSAVEPYGCEVAGVIFGCDYYYYDILIGDACPLTCDECPIHGDVNQDGLLNVLDVVMLIDWILTGYSYSDLELSIADMTNDGLVNVLDIVALVSTILNP